MQNFTATAALLLTVLVLVLPEDSAAQKPGNCPHFDGKEGTCIRQCYDDDECPDDKKCCSHKCGRVCTTPGGNVNPTTLPGDTTVSPVDTTVLPVDTSVSPVDTTVSPVAPLTTLVPGKKKGVCPLIPRVRIRCTTPPQAQCTTDRNCPCNQKCCNVPCGRMCLAPLPEIVKPGSCPLVDPKLILCKKPVNNQCAMDNDCPCNQKCCNTRCGRICLSPVPVVKPGVCPTVIRNAMCIRFDRQCTSDADCPATLKCCSTQCGTGCVQPGRVRPGICPLSIEPYPSTKPACRIYCNEDNDCKKPLKCCVRGGCTRICLMPQKQP